MVENSVFTVDGGRIQLVAQKVPASGRFILRPSLHCRTRPPPRGHQDMICSSCRQTLLSRFPGRGCSPPRIRLMSTVPPISPLHSQSSPEIAVQDSRTSPTSPSTPRISKPLSSPMHPSTSNALRPNQSKQTRLPKLVGSIPGGTPLQGLGYLKAKPTIVAKEDDEYPDWLWRILIPESGAKPTGGKSAADIAGELQWPSSHLELPGSPG